MTNPNGADDLMGRLAAAPPQRQAPTVQIPITFQAGPVNAQAQKVDTASGPMILLVIATPQAAVTTFWPEGDWKTLLAHLNGAWSGLQIPDAAPKLITP